MNELTKPERRAVRETETGRIIDELKHPREDPPIAAAETKDECIERQQSRIELLEAVYEAGLVWVASDDAGHSSACSEDSFCEVSYAYCEACKLRDALKLAAAEDKK